MAVGCGDREKRESRMEEEERKKGKQNGKKRKKVHGKKEINSF